MAFYESPRFPERISYGAIGGPAFSTHVVAVISGDESRNSNWAYPLHSWDVSYGAKTQADFEAIREHFMSVRGRQHGFRFKDWTDYSVAVADGIVSGITTKTFQLLKRYSSGAQSLSRKITKPIAAGFALLNSGTPLVLTTDYTLDTVTGIVTTVADQTAANFTWSGEFDVPMRYDTDRLQARVVSANPSDGFIHSWESVPIVELRTP